MAMQREPSGLLRGSAWPSIQRIADDGVANPREMHAELVRAARHRLEHERRAFVSSIVSSVASAFVSAAPAREHTHAGDARMSARCGAAKRPTVTDTDDVAARARDAVAALAPRCERQIDGPAAVELERTRDVGQI